MLVVTYYCEHNHNWPVPRSSHHKTAAARSVKTPISEEEEEEDEEEEVEEEEELEEKKPRVSVIDRSEEEIAPENKFGANNGEGLWIQGGEFGWFADFESASCTLLESPMLAEDGISTDSEMAMIFTMREEDESLFADLGELPECSTVFRRGMVQREAEQRRPELATTG